MAGERNDGHVPSTDRSHVSATAAGSPLSASPLAEAFNEFGANIVRLNSERIPGTGGARYVTRIAAWIPQEKTDACLATVANTAAQMNLTCKAVPA